MTEKKFCSSCKIHCYREEERKKIREVMKFSGPRMLIYHPLLVIKHSVQSNKLAHILSMRKILWIILGLISLFLGVLGAILPLLPAFPFFLLAAFSFTKGSKRLDKWFRESRIYNKHIDAYSRGEGLTKLTKVKVLLMITFLMGFGFIMMLRKGLIVPCTILFFIWLFHLYYFIKKVKTK